MERPRVLFYSHDTVGLGHLSRTLTVAEELARQRRDLAMLVVTGAPTLAGFDPPPAVDLVRLPTHGRRDVYGGLPRGEVSPPPGLLGLAPAPGIWHVRAELIAAAARAFAPDVFVADHHPNGVHNELLPALAELRAGGRARTLAILDEFIDRPEAMRRIWGDGSVFADLLRVAYDRVLIRGDEHVFPTATAYGLPADLLPRTSYSGYAAREPARTAVDAARAELTPDGAPLVVVTVGGGADAGPLLASCVEALAGLPALAALIVTGPLLPPAERARLEAAASANPRLHLAPSRADLTACLAAADLTITMAGYSSIAEVMAVRTRALVIPRVKPWPEQRLRAERFAELGLVTMLHPDDATPERLRAAIPAALAAPEPSWQVDCDGRVRQARAILDLLSPGPPT